MHATICDLWDANVHMQAFEAGKVFRCDAASGGFMVNLWGKSKGDAHPCVGNAAKGQVKAWGTIARD